MVDNYEKAKGESSEWRTGSDVLDPIGLEWKLDPCAPASGYYAVKARLKFTVAENGLLQSWRGHGLAFVNPPWSEVRRAVVPWLRKFFAEADGGIFVCVARTSADWFQELVLPSADLLCFPTGKTRFIKPDGSPGPSPTNGVALIAKGEMCCDALRRSGLGHCLFVDRSAAPPARLARVQVQSQFALSLGRQRNTRSRLPRL